MTEVVLGKTRVGQLMYDLAFTDLDERYIARKHKITVAEVHKLRAGPEMQKLRDKVRNEGLGNGKKRNRRSKPSVGKR